MSEAPEPPANERAIARRMGRIYAWYTVGFVAFVLALGAAETLGMPR